MEQIKEYLFAIISAAFICAIAVALVEKNERVCKLMKLLSGLVLTVVVLSPCVSIQINDLSDYLESFDNAADYAVRSGLTYADLEQREMVEKEMETYIQNKASSMDLDVDVQVVLSEESFCKPESVKISGMLSPFSKQVLSEFIVQNLEIPKEAQEWK